jgi:hypothetical protein
MFPLVVGPLGWFICLLGCESFHFVPCIRPCFGCFDYFMIGKVSSFLQVLCAFGYAKRIYITRCMLWDLHWLYLMLEIHYNTDICKVRKAHPNNPHLVPKRARVLKNSEEKYTELNWGLKLWLTPKFDKYEFHPAFFSPDCLELIFAIAMCLAGINILQSRTFNFGVSAFYTKI